MIKQTLSFMKTAPFFNGQNHPVPLGPLCRGHAVVIQPVNSHSFKICYLYHGLVFMSYFCSTDG